MCGSNLANDTTISANHAVFKAPAIKYYRAKWGVAHHNREAHPRRLYTTAEEEEKKGGEVVKGVACTIDELSLSLQRKWIAE